MLHPQSDILQTWTIMSCANVATSPSSKKTFLCFSTRNSFKFSDSVTLCGFHSSSTASCWCSYWLPPEQAVQFTWRQNKITTSAMDSKLLLMHLPNTKNPTTLDIISWMVWIPFTLVISINLLSIQHPIMAFMTQTLISTWVMTFNLWDTSNNRKKEAMQTNLKLRTRNHNTRATLYNVHPSWFTYRYSKVNKCTTTNSSEF